VPRLREGLPPDGGPHKLIGRCQTTPEKPCPGSVSGQGLFARSPVHSADAGAELPLPSWPRHRELGGDLARVSPFVLDHCATVAIRHVRWLFKGTCTRFEGQPIGIVGVVGVDVEKGTHWFAEPNLLTMTIESPIFISDGRSAR
jgi:hypothetical protein